MTNFKAKKHKFNFFCRSFKKPHDIQYLSEKNKWFLVQTNDDHWVSDTDGRKLVSHHFTLNKKKKNLYKQSLKTVWPTFSRAKIESYSISQLIERFSFFHIWFLVRVSERNFEYVLESFILNKSETINSSLEKRNDTF